MVKINSCVGKGILQHRAKAKKDKDPDWHLLNHIHAHAHAHARAHAHAHAQDHEDRCHTLEQWPAIHSTWGAQCLAQEHLNHGKEVNCHPSTNLLSSESGN